MTVNLNPPPENAAARVRLTNWPATDDILEQILDPQKPVITIKTSEVGCSQKSDFEAEIIANLAWKLIDQYQISQNRIAIISPHRAQNNAIIAALLKLSGCDTVALPLIDTVERMQGAEKNIILFGFTSSNPNQVIGEFLNHPNRFNVAITRTRLKLIVIGSKTFFSAIGNSETELNNNACFKQFINWCRENGCYIQLPKIPVSEQSNLI